MSLTIAENLGVLKAHVTALEARAEAAEGKLDLIKRRLEGEPDDSLAVDFGGTGWEYDPVVLAVEALAHVARTLQGMYFSRLRKYERLEARMGLLRMSRAQIGIAKGDHNDAKNYDIELSI